MPTPEQIEQCRLAEQDMIELIGRLQAEGMDLRILMAAIGTATATVMLKVWGGPAVPAWFAEQLAMTMHLAKK
jgi:hypothetical protein